MHIRIIFYCDVSYINTDNKKSMRIISAGLFTFQSYNIFKFDRKNNQ